MNPTIEQLRKILERHGFVIENDEKTLGFWHGAYSYSLHVVEEDDKIIVSFTDEVGDTCDPWFERLARKYEEKGYTTWRDGDKIFATKEEVFDKNTPPEKIIKWIEEVIRDFEDTTP